MKQPLSVFLILLMICLPPVVQAQTKAARSAKAPVRKPASVQKVASPATSASKPANAISPAPNRANSAALPVTQTASPAPAQTQAAPVVNRSSGGQKAGRSYARNSGGSGYGYEKGNNLLNIGVGLSSYYYGNPLGISFELGVDKDISVGAQFDYNSGNYGDYYYNSSRWRYTSTYFGVRGSYHVNRILNLNTRKVDLYAGLGLGYRTFRWNDVNYGSGYNYGSGLFVNYFVGGKYYFNDKAGAFLELGYTGLSSSRIGISVKF
jgi:hypothetical protein